MSRLLKSFPELPLKLLALDNTADRNVLIQFLASSPRAAFPGAAVPLKHLPDRPSGPFEKAGGWRHGGINE